MIKTEQTEKIQIPENENIDFSWFVAVLKENIHILAIAGFFFFIIGCFFSLKLKPSYTSAALIKIENSPYNRTYYDLLDNYEIADNNKYLFHRSQTSPANLQKYITTSPYIINDTIKRVFYDYKLNDKPLLKGYKYRNHKELDVDYVYIEDKGISKEFILEILDDKKYSIKLKDDFIIKSGKVGTLEKSINDDIYLEIKIDNIGSNYADTYKLRRDYISRAYRKLTPGLTVKEYGPDTGVVQVAYTSNDRKLSRFMLNEILDVMIDNDIKDKTYDLKEAKKFVDKQIPNLEKDLQTYDSKIKKYKTDKDIIDVEEQNTILLRKTAKLQSNIKDLELKKMALLQKYKPAHPLYVSIENQISALKDQLETSNQELKVVPHNTHELDAIQREKDTFESVYSHFLKIKQNLELMKGSTKSNIKVLTPPNFPDGRHKRLRFLLPLLLSIIGVGIITFCLMVLNYLKATVRNKFLLEKSFNTPVYANIRYSLEQDRITKNKEDNTLSYAYPFIQPVIELKRLATVFESDCLASNSNIIGISSFNHTSGRRFVVDNIASIMKQKQKKSAVVKISLYENERNGAKELDTNQNFDSITLGREIVNNGSIVNNELFNKKINELSCEYDYIFIITPPLVVSEVTSVVFSVIKNSYILVSAGRDSYTDINEIMQTHKNLDLNFKGFIFNNNSIKNYYYYRFSKLLREFSKSIRNFSFKPGTKQAS